MSAIAEFVAEAAVKIAQVIAWVGDLILGGLCEMIAPQASEVRRTLASLLSTTISVASLVGVPLAMKYFCVFGVYHWGVSLAIAVSLIAVVVHVLMRVPWTASVVIASGFHLCFAAVALVITLAF